MSEQQFRRGKSEAMVSRVRKEESNRTASICFITFDLTFYSNEILPLDVKNLKTLISWKKKVKSTNVI